MMRLHWSSVFFDVASHGRQYLMPAAFAFIGATQGNWFWGWLAIISFAISFLITLFRYFTLRFGIHNGELIVSEGLLFRRVRTVPTRRIQNVDLVQNVLHRLCGVAEVRIETASGSESEAVLRVLTRPQIELLRKQIFEATQSVIARQARSQRGGSPRIPDEVPGVPSTESLAFGEGAPGAGSPDSQLVARQAAHPVTLLRLRPGWLVLAGLASNRGWLMLGLALGVAYQFDLFERLDDKKLWQWIPRLLGHWPDWWVILLLAMAGMLVLKALGVGWFFLRFWGYRLERVGEDLRVTSGLLTSYSATIPQQRIQFISVQASPLLRLAGLATIRIETAGGSTAGAEEHQTGLSRSWFVPVVPRSQVPALLEELRPGIGWDEKAVTWQSASRETWRRLSRRAIWMPVPVAIAGWWFAPAWGWLGGVLLAGVLLFLAWRSSRSMKYSRTSFGVAFRSGLLTRKLSLTFFERLQAIRIDQSPFDRRWHMARLSLDTAAAGPAEHRIDVPWLDESFALREFRFLEAAAASHLPVWN